jgi:alcohol dehydrogenase class IV
MSRWSFAHPAHIVFGEGVFDELPEHVRALDAKRVFVATGERSARESGRLQRLRSLLANVAVDVFDGVEPNPSFQTVDRGGDAIRSFGADLVIGIGGGSALDAARAIAALATNPGSIGPHCRGEVEMAAPMLPLIAIPTTAGTGSEVTAWSVLTNVPEKRKQSVRPPDGWAKVALVDPLLTVTMPPGVTASTGMDAFSHAIEAYWNRDANPISDALSLRAMELIFTHLRRAVGDGQDLEARSAMAEASLLAGVAFSQTQTAGVHAASYGFSIHFGLPHGTSCSLLIPPFLRYNAPAMGRKIEPLCKIAGARDAAGAADAITRLASDVHLPTRLSPLRITEADFDLLLDAPFSANIKKNPRNVDRRQIKEMLREIL